MFTIIRKRGRWLLRRDRIVIGNYATLGLAIGARIAH